MPKGVEISLGELESFVRENSIGLLCALKWRL